MKLEVCCADIESVMAAKEGGAHRIELCEALELDGLTPGEELMRQAIATGIPVQVLIRVREGDFVYTPEEVRPWPQAYGLPSRWAHMAWSLAHSRPAAILTRPPLPA